MDPADEVECPGRASTDIDEEDSLECQGKFIRGEPFPGFEDDRGFGGELGER